MPAGDLTFAMIKPDAISAGNCGRIMARIEARGFTLRAARMARLSRVEAEAFYAVHKGRPFFEELVEFVSSGPLLAMVLQADGAVAAWREVIGATDPADAAADTIRKDFAESKGRNAVHGSDSDENASLEINFFFPSHELALLGVSLTA